MEQLTAKDALITQYAAEYMEKIFYFCLKKTGGVHQAEELSSDISLNVLAALTKGTVPEHFSAWVWQIARNRYSVWAKRKNRSLHSIANDDIQEMDIRDMSADTEQACLHSEQMSLLRRELAFISSDYRRIVAAYYLDGASVKDISASLDMPPGTVMTRLHRARKILKEGMEMAREFGRRSYQPENLGFSSSGNQPSGLPFSAIKRKIPTNILLHANNNPCTVEELALELGVAMPYMEEEVELLQKSELLLKLPGGKYLTGFFISPRECQNEINELDREISERYAGDYWRLGGIALSMAQECGVRTDAYCENDAQMYFALYFEQILSLSHLPTGVFTKFQRADGGNWGFMGHELGGCYPVHPIPMSNNGSLWRGLRWDGYQSFVTEGNPLTQPRYALDVPDNFLHSTLRSVAEGETLLPAENGGDDLSILVQQGFVTNKDGSFRVNAIVSKGDSQEQLLRKVQATPEYAALSAVTKEYLSRVRKIVVSYCSPYLEEDLDYYTGMSGLLRGVLLRRWTDQNLYHGNFTQFCAFFY